MTFGEKVKELRLSRGYSQQQLAAALGVSQAAISAWELAVHRNLNPQTIKKIADYFGVPASVLIASDDSVSHEFVQAMSDTINKNPKMNTLFETARFLTPSDLDVVIAVAKALLRKQ